MFLQSRYFFSRLATSTIHSRCFASTLVIAEQIDGGKLAPVTLNALTAASQLKQDIDCVIFGADKTAETTTQLQKFNNSNIKKIFVAENVAFKGLLSEAVTPVLLDLQKKNNYTHILGGSSTFTKSILPRLAALLDVQPISDITKVVDKDQFIRFVYAGNAVLKLKSNDTVKIITVRGTAFEATKEGGGSGQANVEKLDSSVKNDLSEFVERQIQQSERPELPSARIIFSGGRALKSKENFKLLYDLADLFPGQATVGASRAAVDAGYCTNDLQIGQTGKIVAPDLYVAIGISGAIQHIAGMKDSKVIVAINKDGDAPIFAIADYGLVGDLFKVIPELNEKLKKK
ncbi:unnamed protein product [Rotaria magnacalcarata]|uniref:Electron transfer flavoprotein subunit alpha n=2 Tax=Rotaria magnacalcarata TaxID=392030 RepID=A0A816ZPA5_9BILA|nr:unnamed protein product [Rotaria magnacalcarata]CAF4214836.1 unnamed protein product [Rotaria magnacalcarata]